ncbi:glycosyltransferase family 4 protein [Brachybacterium huguangmaarense]
MHLVPPQDDDGTRHVLHEGLEVLRIPMAPSSPRSVLSAGRRLRVALRGADLVHSMAFSALLPLAFHRPPTAWVHTEHWSALTTPQTLPLAAQQMLPAALLLERRPDVVTAVCEFLARPLRRARPRRSVHVVPCIVEPGAPAPRRPRPHGDLRLVSVGGLIERKDPLVAVSTLAELVRRGVDAHLTWIGDGPLRDETAAYAAERGVADRLDLAGSRSSTEVRSALAASDLFFGPTRADNFFVSAAEALVAGRPVVLGSTGGQSEYVRGEVGRLVDAQDPVDYADAIVDLDAATATVPSEAIARTVGDRFSSARVAEGYLRAHAEAMARF